MAAQNLSAALRGHHLLEMITSVINRGPRAAPRDEPPVSTAQAEIDAFFYPESKSDLAVMVVS